MQFNKNFTLMFFCIITAVFLFTKETGAHTSQKDTPFHTNKHIALTEEEKLWLKTHPNITLGFTEAFEPFVIKDEDGNLSGIMVDFLKQINHLLNTDIKIDLDLWPKTHKKAKNRKTDGILLIHEAQTNRLNLKKTKIVIREYPVFFINKNADFEINSLDDIKGKKIAVPKKTSLASEFLAPYKNDCIIIKCLSVKEQFEMLSSGKADIALALSSSVFLITKHNHLNITSSYVLWDKPINAVMAIRSDWPELITILNKAIDCFSTDELNALYSKWYLLPKKAPFDYILFLKIVAAALIILMFFLYSNIRLRKTVKEKSSEKQSIEEQYNTLFESANDATYLIKEGKITICNQKTVTLFGYNDKSEIIGKRPDELSPSTQAHNENSKELSAIKIEEALKGNPQIFEWLHKKKDGVIFKAQITTTPIRVNSETCVLAVARDITYIKETEKQLHNTQLHYENFLKYSTDAVSYWKLPPGLNITLPEKTQLNMFYDAVCIDLNRASWLAYGAKSEEEIINKKYREILRERNQDKFLQDFIRNNYKLNNYELAEESSFGTIKYSIINIVGIIENDELKYAWATSKNITELKEINQKLTEAKNKAEDSDALKTAFLANISHEINTPLNGILGFADLLLDPDISPAEQSEYTNNIIQSGKRMLAIIKDIIDASKIESNQITLNKTKVSLNKILNEAYRLFNLEAMNKEINFTINTPLSDEECIVDVDKVRISQVITNLLTNAFKFTQDKGEISFGYTVKNDCLEIYVKDNGLGVDESMHNTIFERFRQVDIHDKGNYQGSGLGLSISKSFIEKHGGKIWIKSKLGLGATLYFTLPFINDTDALDEEEEKSNDFETPIEEYTILVAEDDNINFKLLNHILKSYNIETIRAINGLEAIQMIEEKENIDLVLMDIKMPKMNGLEATKIIKEKHPDTPVIAQSAFNGTEDIQKALEAGCNEFISKPINKKMLYATINKFLMSND